MNHNIYISSLAFPGQTVEGIIEIAQEHNWNLEFSSGIPYRFDMETIYLKAPIKRLIHNYFPAPLIPFVINLASSDEKIRTESINHCIKALSLAKLSGAPFYAAHSGFCIDPKPDALGNKIHYLLNHDKEYHKQIFLHSVNEVLTEASKIGIDFLIENNVFSQTNYIKENINPFLCCDSNELKWIFETINNDHFGLLLDVAHLKVSCKTLGLNLDNECEQLYPYIKGLHHSDNNGISDDNQPIDENYWFFKHLKHLSAKVHVIEVKNININIIQQQINFIEKNGN